MEYGGILRRAWRITWDNKYLWWLGFLTALGSGGGGGNFSRFNSSGGGPGPGGPGFEGPPDFVPPGGLEGGILAVVIAVACLVLIIAIVVWWASVTARGGLISAANQIEDTATSSFSEGWRAGRERFWRMFGISLVTGVPGLLIAAAVIALAVLGVFAGAGISELGADPTAILATGGLALVCLIPIICILALVSIALSILRPFADRACMLEDEAVISSYRRGWDVLRDNLGNSIVLGVISFLVSFVIGIVIVIPILILAVAAGFGLGGFMGGFDNLAAISAPLIIVAVCGFLVFFVIAMAIGAVQTTFFSSMWTLAYREFTGLEQTPDVGGAEPTLAA